MRVAILDDIHHAYEGTTGIRRLRDRAEVQIFIHPFGDPSALRGRVRLSQPFRTHSNVCASRGGPRTIWNGVKRAVDMDETPDGYTRRRPV